VGLTTLPCKKENVEKPPRNSAGFCGGGQGLRWAVESRSLGLKLDRGKLDVTYLITHKIKVICFIDERNMTLWEL
jgi:hypothetical protein